ncbi:uncharacterized protein LOC102572435 [Alligator mississippiensis]|uniref:Uncharacterized protein n=1 Tax=Alligator mississippiensis TaxID=8496 RepID=A0A151M5T2_ALLMI|nr:uncharacterized protein LOC102572435 [Alligator mississippiensis]KYO19877.1 hypothetical protein Y1Q_0006839 [Alligator mississippiensis]
MMLRRDWAPLGVKIAILLVLCLHLPGVAPRSIELPEGGTPDTSAQPEWEALENEVSSDVTAADEEEILKPLVEYLEKNREMRRISPDVLWSWIPALRDLIRTTTLRPSRPPTKPTPSMPVDTPILETTTPSQPADVQPTVPETLSSAQPPFSELSVSIPPAVSDTQPPHVGIPLTVQPRTLPLFTSGMPDSEELESSTEKVDN